MIHDNMGLEKERLQSKVMGSPLNETKKRKKDSTLEKVLSLTFR